MSLPASRSRRLVAVVIAAGVVLGGAVASSVPAQAASGHRVAHYGPPNIAAAFGSNVSLKGRAPTSVSHNWSGYAVTSKTPFTYVHATFVQPAITCAGRPYQWTSNWVGLDGWNDGTVEQDGTFAHCGGSGWTTPYYYAWYEMYPAGSVVVFRVQPGDVIDTTVAVTSAGKFRLTVADLSSGKSAVKQASCAACQRTSAEWIVERPALCADDTLSSCFLTELADFGSTSMSGAEAQVAGGPMRGLSGMFQHPVDMVDTADGGGFISLDGIGAVSGRSFPVTWFRSGNIYPIDLS